VDRAFFYAAQAGDLAKVNELASGEPSPVVDFPNDMDSNMTALMAACVFGHEVRFAGRSAGGQLGA
jgi:hypothetical protein